MVWPDRLDGCFHPASLKFSSRTITITPSMPTVIALEKMDDLLEFHFLKGLEGGRTPSLRCPLMYPILASE